MEYLTEKYIESDLAMQYETNIVDDGWLFKHTEKEEVEKMIYKHFKKIFENSCYVNETGIDKFKKISIIIIDNKSDEVIGHCTIEPKLHATTDYKRPFLMKTAFLLNNGVLRGALLCLWYFVGCRCNWKVWKVHATTVNTFPFFISATAKVFENIDHIMLSSMAIHPNYQRMGFGTILMNQVIDHINKYYNINTGIDENEKENENEMKNSDKDKKIAILLASMTPKSKGFYDKCGFKTMIHSDFYADTINRKVNIWFMMYNYNYNYNRSITRGFTKQSKDINIDDGADDDDHDDVNYFKNQIDKEYQRAQLVDRRKTYVVGTLVSIMSVLLFRRVSLRFYR